MYHIHILIRAILRYVRTYCSYRWKMKETYLFTERTIRIHEYERKQEKNEIIRKIIDRLCSLSVFILFKRIDSKTAVDPMHNKKRFIKMSHAFIFIVYYMRECVHDFTFAFFPWYVTKSGGWLSLISLFYFSHEKILNRKIYCRLSLSFYTMSPLVCIRLHKAVQILNLNQIRKQLRNFLGNDTTSKIQFVAT